MSSIAGFFHPFFDFTADHKKTTQVAEAMCDALSRRGPNHSYHMITSCGAILHTSLDISPKAQLPQPQHGPGNLKCLSLAMDGNIYNMTELRSRLLSRNISARELNDCEILIYLFYLYGVKFVQLLRGSFAICLLDEFHHRLYLFRDPLGIKPLFFHMKEGTMVFASELKGIFAYPGVTARLDLRGLNEVFSLGPARTCGCGVYKDILEVKPGHILTYSKEGYQDTIFWKLESRVHQESYEDTLEHLSFLLKDSVKRQVDPEAYNCCMLSGGLDSSLISAMVNEELKAQGIGPLRTISFDFTDSRKYFQANDFQPSLDRPFVSAMAEHLASEHVSLECTSEDQTALLYQSVNAHDLPCMADISSSLLHFCGKTAAYGKVAFTGECADEIFCGYPWYHKASMSSLSTFPWTSDLHPRRLLLKEDFLSQLKMEEYVSESYHASLKQVSLLPGESSEMQAHRQLFVLTTTWFMGTLLERMDRAASYCGICARLPFADILLIEYLYNVPWEMKSKHGEVKHLLREIAKPYLPETIIQRKKSPYPKNYNPAYEQLLIRSFKSVLADKNSPILQFIDPGKVLDFCEQKKDYAKPWFGQLMAGPQLLAYYLQINYWLKKYNIHVEL